MTIRIQKQARRFLTGLAVSSAVLLAPTTQAAEGNLWKEVRDAGVLKCGAAVAAPYVMKDAMSSQYSGYFVDLCRDFGENVLKVKVEFVDTNWDNLIAGMQSKKWDLAMALNQTPERALAIAFSVPATSYEVSFLVNKNNPKFEGADASLENYDKKGVTFAVMSGTSQDKAVSAVIKNATIMRLPGMDETRLAVMSKRADVLVDANDTNHLFALANPDWAKEINPEPALAKQGVSFGLRRDTSFADQQVLNIYLEQRKDKGEIQALVDKASQAVLSK
jgi:polar amino acid transport system substrate-binding protein